MVALVTIDVVRRGFLREYDGTPIKGSPVKLIIQNPLLLLGPISAEHPRTEVLAKRIRTYRWSPN